MAPTEIDYKSYLASVIECEEKQDGSIQHEWTFNEKNGAVKVANFLRSYGYKVKLEKMKLFSTEFHYVGVPFETLRRS